MTSSDQHAHFEELVVGHALSALEPEDEQALLRHLPSCAACDRDLADHRETLAHLACAAEPSAPPPGLWEGIRREVLAESGPSAFATPTRRTAGSAGTGSTVDTDEREPAGAERAGAERAGVEVADLGRARERRSGHGLRAAGWLSAAAAAALVLSLGVWNVSLQQDRDTQAQASRRLTAAVQALEASPARTVPLTGQDGTVRAVAVVQRDKVDLVVDGIDPNDAATSTYVLWGKLGDAPAQALGTFDVGRAGVLVVRDLRLLEGAERTPDVLVITREAGRTAPRQSQQIAVAAGRAA